MPPGVQPESRRFEYRNLDPLRSVWSATTISARSRLNLDHHVNRKAVAYLDDVQSRVAEPVKMLEELDQLSFQSEIAKAKLWSRSADAADLNMRRYLGWWFKLRLPTGHLQIGDRSEIDV